MTVMIRGLSGFASGGGSKARLCILIYHRVLPQPDPMRPDEIDASRFDWQLGALLRFFNVIPLSEAVQALANGALPRRAVCVTFDDGYADNYEIALPILKKWRVPATFFVASGFLDGGCMWNDAIIEAIRQAPGSSLDLTGCGYGVHIMADWEGRYAVVKQLIDALRYLPMEQRERQVHSIIAVTKAKIPNTLMMRSDQVRGLHNAGMEVGGHTVNHPILLRVDKSVARSEIADNKAHLEGITGAPVRLFAYPNGRPRQDFDIEHVRLVQQLGFQAAVTTAWGAANTTTSVYQLPRFTPWDKSPTRFALRLIHNYRKSAAVAA